MFFLKSYPEKTKGVCVGVCVSVGVRILLTNSRITELITIRVPKVPFRIFDKLKNEIQNSILRFCFHVNTKSEIQIINCHFHV